MFKAFNFPTKTYLSHLKLQTGFHENFDGNVSWKFIKTAVDFHVEPVGKSITADFIKILLATKEYKKKNRTLFSFQMIIKVKLSIHRSTMRTV